MGDTKSRNINRGLGIKSSHRYARPGKVQKGVPNVIGLDIREAIQILEDAGLNVSFTGTGMVTAQSLASGSNYVRGQRINLRLRNA